MSNNDKEARNWRGTCFSRARDRLRSPNGEPGYHRRLQPFVRPGCGWCGKIRVERHYAKANGASVIPFSGLEIRILFVIRWIKKLFGGPGEASRCCVNLNTLESAVGSPGHCLEDVVCCRSGVTAESGESPEEIGRNPIGLDVESDQSNLPLGTSIQSEVPPQ